MAKDFKKATQTMTTALDALLPDTAQQEQEALEALQTQGKKGMKLPRINLAFSPSNLDYIRVMSGIRGESMTQFVNYVIAKDREAHGDKYQAAKALMEEDS
jgi:hypothetical protein